MSAGTAFSVNQAKISQTGDSMFSGMLTPEQSQDYFALAEKTSIVQKVATKIPMGPTGVKIPHWNGDVSASWLGEGDMKPITKGDMTSQSIAPNKIATIFIASAETVRANPANYLGTMRTKVATAIAMAFDSAAMHGTNSPFGAYIDQSNKVQYLGTNAYNALGVDGLTKLVSDGKKWQATLLDDTAEPILNGSLDLNGRPLFVESTYDSMTTPFREGRILGRPTVLSDHVASGACVGYTGDFSQILWGQVGGLSFDVTDQATLNLGTFASPNFVSLWQHNLVAVRVEAEYGLLVNDPNAFVRLVTGPLVYTVTKTGTPTGGTFTLTVNGVATGTIAYDASAATVKAAIVAVDDGLVAADVTVTGSAGGPWTVTVAASIGLGSAAGLTGGTSPTVTVVAA